MIVLLVLIIGMLGMGLWKLNKIEKLLEYWGDLPKNEKHWGWGKHK